MWNNLFRRSKGERAKDSVTTFNVAIEALRKQDRFMERRLQLLEKEAGLIRDVSNA